MATFVTKKLRGASEPQIWELWCARWQWRVVVCKVAVASGWEVVQVHVEGGQGLEETRADRLAGGPDRGAGPGGGPHT